MPIYIPFTDDLIAELEAAEQGDRRLSELYADLVFTQARSKPPMSATAMTYEDHLRAVADALRARNEAEEALREAELVAFEAARKHKDAIAGLRSFDETRVVELLSA